MSEKNNNVHDLSSRLSNNELTYEQLEYWWGVLEDSERAAEYARRMLKIGKYATEKGID